MRELSDVWPWLTPWRLKAYPAALLVALIFTFAYSVATGDGARIVSGRLGGDFPAFYAAGKLVATGHSEQLYDWSAQSAAQKELFPEARGHFLPFAYPPYVALIYAPFSWLPYRWSFVLHTCLMALLLVAAAYLLGPVLPRLGRYPFALFALMIAFYPIFRSLLGGQNTPLTMFLLALSWHALARNRQATLGVALAVMLFKPQFGLLMSALNGLRATKRSFFSWFATSTATYGLGVFVGGVYWIPSWLSQAQKFQFMDQSVNSANSVGILGFLEAALRPGSLVAIAAGLMVSACLVIWLMLLWWRRREPLNLRMAITCAALPLISPHAMYYDGGIALFSLFVLLEHGSPRSALTLCVLYFASFLTPLSSYLGLNPLFLVLAAILVKSLMLRREWMQAQVRLAPSH